MLLVTASKLWKRNEINSQIKINVIEEKQIGIPPYEWLNPKGIELVEKGKEALQRYYIAYFFVILIYNIILKPLLIRFWS